MKKSLLIILLVAFMFGCNNQSQENTSSANDNETQNSEVDNSKIGRKNFAVVWNWKFSDKQMLDDYLLTISSEMEKLWKDDIIENVYFQSDAEMASGYFPNISCFVKAQSLDEAKATLNNLTLVKNGLANYKIYPVGMKWLGRETKVIKSKGLGKSFVAVWSELETISAANDGDIIVAQADSIMSLWRKGIIENVYFDVEGTQSANDVTDFVFFVNTDTEKEAKEICDNLPFSIKGKASYKIKEVGVFWLGKHQ